MGPAISGSMGAPPGHGIGNGVSFHSKCKVLGQRSDTVQQFREPGQRSVPRFF